MSSTAISPGALVLVTGVNGFLGSYIADFLLQLGYRVRGTVRSEDKAEWVKEALLGRHPGASFETVVVPDAAAPGAWKDVQGAEGVVHVASDMSFAPDPNKVITPTLRILQSLLEAAAAAREPAVKRFVLTSSDVALAGRVFDKELPVDGSSWNEAAVEGAWRPPPYHEDRKWDVYAASKTQAEQALWKFAREQKPGFVANAVLPAFVTGPNLHPKQAGSTGGMVRAFWGGNAGLGAFLQAFGASHFVDVEDVARLHAAALVHEDVQAARLLGFADRFNYNSFLDVFRELAPDRPWPAYDPGQLEDGRRVDGAREREVLKHFGRPGWTSFHDSVKRVCLESRA